MVSFVTVLVRFVRAVASSWRDPEFRRLFTLVVVTLLSGTLFYRQVGGWGFLDSLYFSVVTLTTVGYGDLSPSTAAGKVFTVPCVFVGWASSWASSTRWPNARRSGRTRHANAGASAGGLGGKRSSRLRTLCWGFPHVDRELGRR